MFLYQSVKKKQDISLTELTTDIEIFISRYIATKILNSFTPI